MMEAVRTSETSVDNHFTRQYNSEDSSEHHTRRPENLKSHNEVLVIATAGQVSNLTQAVMDFGSTTFTPYQPVAPDLGPRVL
jgi:hypothetical protein